MPGPLSRRILSVKNNSHFLLSWVFVARWGLSLVVESQGLVVSRFYCGDFSHCGAQALGHTGFRSCARGLNSCGSRALIAPCVWNLPRPGIDPVSPALDAGSLPLAPPVMGFPGGSDGKESVCNAGDPRLIPGSGISPGEGNGNSLQYSCLDNPMDREAWQAPVHRVTKSWTQLSNCCC